MTVGPTDQLMESHAWPDIYSIGMAAIWITNKKEEAASKLTDKSLYNGLL
jgi:hypothetical protein